MGSRRAGCARMHSGRPPTAVTAGHDDAANNGEFVVTAASVNTFTIGAITFESNTGNWHTSDPDIEMPDIDSALLIDQSGYILDVTFVVNE